MDYELIDLSMAVDLVSKQKKCKYRDSVRTRGINVSFDIKFQNRKSADEFSFAWAYSIRQFYDGDFILFLHCYYDGRLIPVPKIYKAGPAPKKSIVTGHQRPERRLPFY